MPRLRFAVEVSRRRGRNRRVPLSRVTRRHVAQRRIARGPVEARGPTEERGQTSVAELRELDELKRLSARGQRVGVLTCAEIATGTAEAGLDETDVEALHGLLESCGIELVEQIDPASSA